VQLHTNKIRRKSPPLGPQQAKGKTGCKQGHLQPGARLAKKPCGQLKLDKHRAHLVTHLAGIGRRRTGSIDGKPVPWSVALLRAEACVATVEKRGEKQQTYLPPTPGSPEAPRREHAAEWQAAYETEICRHKRHGTYEPGLTERAPSKARWYFE
jgi:hypothetical protein